VRHNAKEFARNLEGLPPPPPWVPEPEVTEYGEFVKSLLRFRVVPLWDLQLAGLAENKLPTAQALFPEDANPSGKTLSARSIPRGLLKKIERALAMQDQAVGWVRRLRATV